MRKRFRSSRRSGAVLIAAIVVLFIVSMLAIQTTKTMSTIRYGDQRQSALRQAQELVELGRLVHKHRSSKAESTDAETKISISFGDGETGSIEIITADETNSVRIKAAYKQGDSPATAASWEGEYE